MVRALSGLGWQAWEQVVRAEEIEAEGVIRFSVKTVSSSGGEYKKR